MNPKSKSVAQALAETAAAGLIAKSQRLESLAAVVAETSRELLPQSEPPDMPDCEIRDGTLFICVASPSYAAKLRQCAPLLEARLRERDAEVTRIRIRHQPRRSTDREAVTGLPPTPPRSAEDVAAALAFADGLVDRLHDSALREAAIRLQATLRRRLARQGGEPA